MLRILIRFLGLRGALFDDKGVDCHPRAQHRVKFVEARFEHVRQVSGRWLVRDHAGEDIVPCGRATFEVGAGAPTGLGFRPMISRRRSGFCRHRVVVVAVQLVWVEAKVPAVGSGVDGDAGCDSRTMIPYKEMIDRMIVRV